MTDELDAAAREQDNHWRAAALIDYVSMRLRTHGYKAPTGLCDECGALPTDPSCPFHALTHLHTLMMAAINDGAAVDAAELHQAYTLAITTLESVTWPDRPPAPQLRRLAEGLRRLGDIPNPRYPRIREEFVSMFASELDSYTCWRCAATSHSAGDVAYRYCVNCHLFESREETTLS